VRFDRMSRNTNPVAAAAAEGGIDPWLKTLSFWNDDARWRRSAFMRSIR